MSRYIRQIEPGWYHLRGMDEMGLVLRWDASVDLWVGYAIARGGAWMISAWNAEGQIYSKAISRHDLAMPIARFPALRRVDSPSEAHFATFWRWYDDCHNPKGYCDELRPCLFRAWLTAQAKNAKGWTEFVQEAKRSRLAASDGRKSLKDALFE